MWSESEQARLISIVESGLELVGRQAKEIIINYLKYKYGLTIDSLYTHKQEFYNYLHEILGESAGIIISRIDQFLGESQSDDVQLPEKKHGQSTDVASVTISTGERHGSNLVQIQRLSHNVSFLLCDQCFWCASLLISNYPLKCQACGHKILSAVSLAPNETFFIEIGPKRGVSIFFR